MQETQPRSTARILWLYFMGVAASILVGAVVAIGTIFAILRYPMWHGPLVHFLYRASGNFFASAVGSTGRGVGNSLSTTLLTLIGTVSFIGLLQGREAMKKHFLENAVIGLTVLIVVILLIFTPQFVWEVAKVGYEDHQGLVSSNTALHGQITDLEAIQNMNPYEKAIINGAPFINTVRAFALLKGLRSTDNDLANTCVVKVTAPRDNSRAAGMLTGIAVSIGCFVTPTGNVDKDPDVGSEATTGAEKDMVLIHAARDNSQAGSFATMLGNTFRVKRSYDLPKNSLANLVWIQIGPGSIWRKE